MRALSTRLLRAASCLSSLSSLLVLGACAPPESSAERESLGPLVSVEAWAPVSASEDPLHAHRPAQVDCPVAAWGAQFGALEVQTGVCNYLALAQPTLHPIWAGDTIELDLWHDTLDAAEPGTGHFALLLDGELLDEIEVEIPADPAVHRLSWTAPHSLPTGASIGLHLHNHGFNSWTVVSLGVLDFDESQ